MFTRNKKWFLFFLFYIASLLVAQQSALSANLKDYYSFQTLSLTREKDGFDGKIVVLRDKRWPTQKDENGDLDLPDVKPTIIELQDGSGQVIQSEEVESLRTSLKEKKLYGNSRSSYLVEQADEGAHGSEKKMYSILAVEDNHLICLEVVERNEKKIPTWLNPMPEWLLNKIKNKETPIFFQTGGSYIVFGNWEFIPSKKNESTDILYWESYEAHNASVSGPPSENTNDFVTKYKRYHYDGNHWRLYEINRLGEVENGKGDLGANDFPPESLFPNK